MLEPTSYDSPQLTPEQEEILLELVENEISYLEGSYNNGDISVRKYERDIAKLSAIQNILGGKHA